MENEEIFKKAIEKAVKNGWEDEVLEYDPEYDDFEFDGVNEIIFITPACDEGIMPSLEYKRERNIYQLIFSHDFAKAFFKDDKNSWIYHLQSMVILEDPIKYLEKFI